MKISAQSHTAIVSAIQKALENYATPGKKGVATDIYFQPDMVSGELTIYNDDDQLLGQLVVKEWVDANIFVAVTGAFHNLGLLQYFAIYL